MKGCLEECPLCGSKEWKAFAAEKEATLYTLHGQLTGRLVEVYKCVGCEAAVPTISHRRHV